MLLVALGPTTSAMATTAAAPTDPEIQIEDVYRFYELYDATGGHPTADQLQHDYLCQRVGLALRKLGRLYPEARFPPVTIAVGRGKPVGIGSAATGLQIGIESPAVPGSQ
jgi:hypothetical protein